MFQTKAGFRRNFSILFVCNSIVHLLNLFTNMYLARSLGPAGFGTYGILVTWSNVILSVASLGVDQVSIRAIAKEKDKALLFFKSSLVIRTLGLCGCLLLFIPFWLIADSLSISYICLIILNAILLLLWNSIQGLAFGIQRMEATGYISALGAIGLLLSYVILPSSFSRVSIFFLLLIIIQGVKDVIYLYKTIHLANNENEEEVTVNGMLSQIKESFPFYILILFGLLTNQFPVLFLSSNSGNTEVAYFNTANKLIIPFTMLVQTFFSALFPKLVEDNLKDYDLFKQNAKKYLYIISFLGVIFCALISLFRNEIVYILYGEEYSQTGMVLLTQCWYSVYFAILSLYGTLFITRGKDRLVAILSITNAMVWFPFLWFTSYYGAVYISYGFVAGAIINMITNSISMIKYNDTLFKKVDLVKINLGLFVVLLLSLIIPDFNIYVRCVFCILLLSFAFGLLKSYKVV